MMTIDNEDNGDSATGDEVDNDFDGTMGNDNGNSTMGDDDGKWRDGLR